MSQTSSASEMTFEHARIRLEGSVERLEAIVPHLQHALSLLESPKWRTELADAPEALEPVILALTPLDQDLEASRRLLARAPCAELSQLVHRVDALSEALTKVARVHSEDEGDSLESLLRATLDHARSELPDPLASDERVLLRRNLDRTWPRVLWILGLSLGGGWLATLGCFERASGTCWPWRWGSRRSSRFSSPCSRVEDPPVKSSSRRAACS